MVPRLWDETIEAHRRAVRDATLDTTAALVAEHGLAFGEPSIDVGKLRGWKDTVDLRPAEVVDVAVRFTEYTGRYVMHCHFELSQTAGGGNYPQGAVTHWEMTAPL